MLLDDIDDPLANDSEPLRRDQKIASLPDLNTLVESLLEDSVVVDFTAGALELGVAWLDPDPRALLQEVEYQMKIASWV